MDVQRETKNGECLGGGPLLHEGHGGEPLNGKGSLLAETTIIHRLRLQQVRQGHRALHKRHWPQDQDPLRHHVTAN